MTTWDMPHSSGGAPAPLTCPAPSQRAAAIPHTSYMPFVCPSPSHDLMHAPWPPLMHPNMIQHALPLLDVPRPLLTRCHCPKHVPCIPHVPWPLPTCVLPPVMVCSPILHIAPNPHSHLRWVNPFPTLSDRPPTPLGHQPASHSLSRTHVCFYHPSLLDILDSP